MCCSRKVFFSNVDRSAMKFKDPFDLEHGFVTVNGLRCVLLQSPSPHPLVLKAFMLLFPACCSTHLETLGSL